MINFNSKTTIYLIILFFMFSLIFSVYISFSKDKNDINIIEHLNLTNNDTTLPDDFNNILNDDLNINLSLDEVPKLDFNSKNCTPLFSFTDSINYIKKYKYSFSGSQPFYITERFKGKLSGLYIIESVSEIFFDNEKYSSILTSYYDEKGKCMYNEYSFNSEINSMECYEDYETFLCEEVISSLIFIGEDKITLSNNIYTVLVYADENNSNIIKYGKDVPVLFYLKSSDANNKYIEIELLNLERII